MLHTRACRRCHAIAVDAERRQRATLMPVERRCHLFLRAAPCQFFSDERYLRMTYFRFIFRAYAIDLPRLLFTRLPPGDAEQRR